MDIEKLTLGQLKKALSTAKEEPLNEGCCVAKEVTTQIVVLDRGFVYVGKPTFSEDKQFVNVTNCRNIRVWGTDKGLGQLVNGPTSKTVLDEVGEILVPVRAIIHILKCKKNW